MYTKKGQNQLSLLGIGDGGVPMFSAIIESIKMVSNIKPIKNKRDLHLHTANFGKRISVAVDNQVQFKMINSICCLCLFSYDPSNCLSVCSLFHP